ncbi:Dolichol-phosphate mannosyltransferase subunit 3 [Lecanosticta acicola]|uniref:Dolichol-phosphate mannosyltransferase subunit 3 n=1 Tax=Lecanosticta acicola TaxID=111012 RepID=A0AAI9EAR6_9PEZI|nr:Dolichol-phosphate mannosyltransferase subunit 3 [Lecanosticta acicola]
MQSFVHSAATSHDNTAWNTTQGVWNETLDEFIDLQAMDLATGHALLCSTNDGPLHGFQTAPVHVHEPFDNLSSTNGLHHAQILTQHKADSQSHERQGSNAAAGEGDMQSQINELRKVVSSLIAEKLPSNDGPRPNRQARLFGSFSCNQSDQDSSRLASGVSTPLDGLASPFDLSDDSPIYSRRGSAASVGSLPTKRGSRIPGGYPCVKCNARFDIPGDLRHHERNHLPNEERPHQCSQCDQRFLYPKDVARHERQVHKTSKVDHAEHQDAECPTPDKRKESHPLNSRQRRERKRQLLDTQAAVRSRERRIRQSRLSFEQKSPPNTQPNSRSGSPERRRYSAIPDIITEDTGNAKLDLLLPDPEADLSQAVKDLQTQVSAQQDTISDLEHQLKETKRDAEVWLSERNTLGNLLEQYTRNFSSGSRHAPLHHLGSTELPQSATGNTEPIDFNQWADFDMGKPP